jgi:hypothetical protein
MKTVTHTKASRPSHDHSLGITCAHWNAQECTRMQFICKVFASHVRIERAACTSYRCLTWGMHMVCAQPGKLPKPLAWPFQHHLCRLASRVFCPCCHHVAHAVQVLDAQEDQMPLQYPRGLPHQLRRSKAFCTSHWRFTQGRLQTLMC